MSAEDDARILADAKQSQERWQQELKQRDARRLDDIQQDIALAMSKLSELESGGLLLETEAIKKSLGEACNGLDLARFELFKGDQKQQ